MIISLVPQTGVGLTKGFGTASDIAPKHSTESPQRMLRAHTVACVGRLLWFPGEEGAGGSGWQEQHGKSSWQAQQGCRGAFKWYTTGVQVATRVAYTVAYTVAHTVAHKWHHTS